MALDGTLNIEISRKMDIKDAVEAFSALSQEARLSVLRLLIEAGDEGVPAGDIARHFGTPQNTMYSASGCAAACCDNLNESPVVSANWMTSSRW